MLRSILQNSTAGFYIFASDSTTPTSGKTGLTITTTLSKAGAAANSVSPTITEIGNGLYWIAPIAAHRDTLGEIAWQFSGTGAIIAPRLEKVVAVDDQTARFGASDGTGITLAADQAVNTTKWGGTAVASANVLIDGAITSLKIASDAITAAKIADNALAAAKFAADAIIAIQNGLATAAALVTAQTSLTTLEGRLTSARAGYLDNLNVGGIVASQADINALNQSASRRIILTTQGQYERPESGTADYFIEARTYDGDGAATNADSNPVITVTGATSGSLAANLGTISNPSTGVYRWTYAQPSNATIEAIRIEVSATIGGSAFPISAMSQSVDFVSATWTTADATKLTAIYDKLPSRAYLGGTTSSTGAPLPSDIGLASANLDAQFDEMLADLATREANIRGADNDTLKTLSDQIDAVPTAAENRQEMDANSAVFGDLKQMITNDGTANAQWTEKALELAPTGSGGGGVSGPVEVDTISGDALDYFNDKFTEVSANITSAIGDIVVATIDLGTTDFPKSLRKGDARTVANGGALTIRVYAASDTDHETPLLGVGTLLFADATATKLGFTLAGEETPEVELDIEWIESGSDGYFLLSWNETALDDATTYKRGGTNYHEWGIKVQWPTTTNSRTVVEGVTKILPAIVSNT